MHGGFAKNISKTRFRVETSHGCRMSGSSQSPSSWEAAFQLALAGTHAPFTVVDDVVLDRRMLL